VFFEKAVVAACRLQQVTCGSAQLAQAIQIHRLGFQLLAQQGLPLRDQGLQRVVQGLGLFGGQSGGECGHGRGPIGDARRFVEVAQTSHVDFGNLLREFAALALIDLQVRQRLAVRQQQRPESGTERADFRRRLFSSVIGANPFGHLRCLCLLLFQRVEGYRDRIQLSGEHQVLLGEGRQRRAQPGRRLQHPLRGLYGLLCLLYPPGIVQGLQVLDALADAIDLDRLLVARGREQIPFHRQAEQFLVKRLEQGALRDVSGFLAPASGLGQDFRLIGGGCALQCGSNRPLLLLRRRESLADRRRSALLIGQLSLDVGAQRLDGRKVGFLSLEITFDLHAAGGRVGDHGRRRVGGLQGGAPLADEIRLLGCRAPDLRESVGARRVGVDFSEVAQGIAVEGNETGAALGIEIGVAFSLADFRLQHVGGHQHRRRATIAVRRSCRVVRRKPDTGQCEHE
jgi:hypothetical protein